MAKSKADIIAAKFEAAGVDPVAGMIRIAEAAEKSNNLPLAGKMYAEMMQYVAPKLKSMEVSFDPEKPLVVDTQARRERIKQLAKSTGLLPAITAPAPAEAEASHQ